MYIVMNDGQGTTSENMMTDEVETSADDNKNKRMTDAEFASATEKYELGTMGISDLADEYGISRQALSKRFKNAGVIRSSRKDEIAKATAKSEKDAAAKAAATAERFTDIRSEKIEETRIQGFSALKQARMLTQKILIDEMKKPTGGNPEFIDGSLRAMGRYNKILVDNLDATLKLLKSDEHVDEEDLPQLIVEDLTDQEILDHHISTGAFPEDTTLEEMLAEELDDDEVIADAS